MSSSGSDIPELEQELNVDIPPPLDPHIASVSLRTGSNNPGDYFDLLLSASFGSEYVTLESGDDTIEVQISIRKAEIKLDGANCSFHLLTDGEVGGDGWKGQDRNTQDSQRTTSRGAGVSVDTGDSVPASKASVGFENSLKTSGQSSRDLDRKLLPWRVISNDTVQVGYLDEFTRVLHGRILDENVSIRATPSSRNNRVGVLARIRVREQWIDIEEIKVISASMRVRSFLEGLLSGSDELEERRRLFSKLLAHLISVKLQDRSDRRNATIAASAMVFSPANGSARGVNLPRPRGAIQIDPTAIERFIQTSVGSEAKLLVELGVQLDPGEDEVSFAEQVEDILETSGNRRPSYYSHGVDKGRILDCISASFGLRAMVIDLGKGDANVDSFPGRAGIPPERSVILTAETCSPLSAAEIVAKLGGQWWSSAIAISAGILTKGDEAYKIARLAGFDLSYQTLRRKMAPFSVGSGYGGLITFADLFRSIERPDAIQRLVGLRIFVPMFGLFELEEAMLTLDAEEAEKEAQWGE